VDDGIPFDPRPRIARDRLIAVLRHAHAGETAAIFAYRGHWKSVRDREERRKLQQIEQDEKDHLEIVAGFLDELGVGPNHRRDRVFWWIGKLIGVLCRLGGWFVPMYGAGMLERPNIEEYEFAARHAWIAGREDWCDTLLRLAEVEWDHEAWLRERTLGHPLSRIIPLWSAPPPRARIRESFEAFTKSLSSDPA
jgi:hypothetical protein